MRRGGARGGAGKNAAKQGTKGKTFDEYFVKIYGKKRWPVLKAAMSSEKSFRVALINKYCSGVHTFEEQEPIGDCGAAEGGEDKKVVQHSEAKKCPVPILAEAGLKPVPSRQLQLWALEDGGVIPAPIKDNTDGALLNGNTLPYYIFDYASALVVEQLGVEPLHKVLDLCAAPGGKSVALAQFLNAQGGGHLTANEKLSDRCARLKRTLTDYLPRDAAPPWEVLQKDGTRYHSPDTYDRVLLDAPCSSERHLLAQGANGAVLGNDWNPEYSAKMAVVQKSLLVLALEMLKVGGVMTYSTCSISPQENDEVVQFVMNKTRCHVVIEESKLPVGEPTGLGWIMLPDVCQGAGPLYVATLKKVGAWRPQDSSSSEEEDSD